jgi:hypothetical protein
MAKERDHHHRYVARRRAIRSVHLPGPPPRHPRSRTCRVTTGTTTASPPAPTGEVKGSQPALRQRDRTRGTDSRKSNLQHPITGAARRSPDLGPSSPDPVPQPQHGQGVGSQTCQEPLKPADSRASPAQIRPTWAQIWAQAKAPPSLASSTLHRLGNTLGCRPSPSTLARGAVAAQGQLLAEILEEAIRHHASAA